jgi:hypothetical protein
MTPKATFSNLDFSIEIREKVLPPVGAPFHGPSQGFALIGRCDNRGHLPLLAQGTYFPFENPVAARLLIELSATRAGGIRPLDRVGLSFPLPYSLALFTPESMIRWATWMSANAFREFLHEGNQNPPAPPIIGNTPLKTPTQKIVGGKPIGYVDVPCATSQAIAALHR